MSQQETRAAIIARLEQGFQEVQDSDRFQDYLATCARFHHYSAHNTMLIWTQRPDATRVAGFQTWKKLGRQVLRGEKGIGILAPRPYRRTVESDNGEEDVIEGCYFHAVHVFDVSQTDGEPLPDAPVTELDGSDDGLFVSLAAIATKEGIALDRTPNASGANGFYRPGTIWVKPEASPRMATKTLAHELGHHFAGHVAGQCKGEMETVAEAVAYIVLAHAGIDAGSYSFGYLASWSDPKVFRAKLTQIHATANQIIDNLEESHAKAA